MPFLAPFVPAIVGAVAGAAVTGGAALLAADKQGHAADKATAAQTEANDKALVAQRENRDFIAGLQKPVIDARNTALDAIMARYNLQPSGAPATGAPAAPGGAVDLGPRTSVIGSQGFGGTDGGTAIGGPGVVGSFDAKSYLTQNPDVAQAFETYAHPGETADQFAARHYQEFGAKEIADGGRSPLATPAATPAAPAGPAAPDPLNPTRAPAAPRPTYETPQFTRPDQPQWQDRGSGPAADDYLGAGKFQADPGYAFRQSEAARGGNASFGARGLLKSGGAIKAAQDRSYSLADQSYQNWFNNASSRLAADRGQFNVNRSTDYNIFNTDRQNLNANFDSERQVGLTQANIDNSRLQADYNTDQARTDNIFSQDRNYLAGQDRNRIGDLFNVVNAGTSAASAVGGASTNYANNSSNIYANQGDTAAQNAYAHADASGNAINAIGGAAANIFSRYQPTAPTYNTQYVGGAAGGNAYGQPGASPFTIF